MIKQHVKPNVYVPEPELLLHQYSVALNNIISLYSTSDKTIVRSRHGWMGECLKGVEYSSANGSCSIKAPLELRQLMQNRFVLMIDTQIQLTANVSGYQLNTDINFLYLLAKEVNHVFEEWFIKNQDKEF